MKGYDRADIWIPFSLSFFILTLVIPRHDFRVRDISRKGIKSTVGAGWVKRVQERIVEGDGREQGYQIQVLKDW